MKLSVVYGIVCAICFYVPLYGMQTPLLVGDSGYESFQFEHTPNNEKNVLLLLNKLALNESLDSEAEQPLLTSLLNQQKNILPDDVGYFRKGVGLHATWGSAGNAVLNSCNTAFLTSLLWTLFECNQGECNQDALGTLGMIGAPLTLANVCLWGWSTWIVWAGLRPKVKKEIVSQNTVLTILQAWVTVEKNDND